MGRNSGPGGRGPEAALEVGQEPPACLGPMLCYSAGDAVYEVSGRGHAQCGPCHVEGGVLWESCLMGAMFNEGGVP